MIKFKFLRGSWQDREREWQCRSFESGDYILAARRLGARVDFQSPRTKHGGTLVAIFFDLSSHALPTAHIHDTRPPGELIDQS